MTELIADEPNLSNKKTKKNIFFTIAGLALILIAYLFIKWLVDWRYIVSTDDAYIAGDITSLSPRIGGYVTKINVQENNFVKKDDILFYIYDEDYKIAAKDAKARLETQKKSIDLLDEQIKAKQISYEQAIAKKNAVLAVKNNADSTLQRIKKLRTYSTQAQLENAQSSLDQATSNLEVAESQIDGVQAEIRILNAQKAETESSTKSLELAFQKAQHDLDSCTVVAPFDGVISNISAQQGEMVNKGQRLAALIPIKELYIVANLKETQLKNVRPGQKVNFTVDASKKKEYVGTVLSVSPATGSIFSLLPPQNATGNFTKVIQRVPVRISIPKEAFDDGIIRAGLSVLVDIQTKFTPKNNNFLEKKSNNSEKDKAPLLKHQTVETLEIQ